MGYEASTRDEAAALLVDPVVNLRVALALSSGGYSFGPWGGDC